MRIHLLTDLPVQVDGEPWIQPAGQVVVLRSALKVRSSVGLIVILHQIHVVLFRTGADSWARILEKL